MNIHIAVNGIRQDPQPEEDVRSKIVRGEIPAEALCWREGWPEWRTVGSVYADAFPAGAVGISGDGEGAGAALAPAEAEAVRQTHLAHEASLKSVGVLYTLGAALCILGGVGSLIGGFADPVAPAESATDPTTAFVVGVLLIALGGVQFQVGRWMRKLNPKARTPATMLSVLGLLGFPLGTLINAYILYLLQSKKGAMVFSPEYAAVMAATPHMKYKTPVLVWIVLAVLVLGLVAMIVSVAAA